MHDGAGNFIAGGSGPAAPIDKPTNLSDLINSFGDLLAKFTKFVGVNSESMMKTGITANLNVQQGAIQINNQIVRQVPLFQDLQGGGGYQLLSSLLAKPDFAGVGGLSIDPMTYNSGVEISAASLGDLPRQSVGGAGMGGGMEMS
jgi:hypothetical protein